MAAPTSYRTCLRRLATPRPLISISNIASHHRQHHTPASAPLYLDFLAPSWQSCKTSRMPRINPRTQTILSKPRDRTLSTTPHRLTSATAVRNPRHDDSGTEMTISILPRAAHRLRAIAAKDANPTLALRVAVESGGCHGFQYLMSLVNTSEVDVEEDTVFEEHVDGKSEEGEYRAKVVMDEPSLELLKGSSIDYTMELIGSQFKVTGIPGATSSCGCGSSFDIAA